jgi:hypothetical protein
VKSKTQLRLIFVLVPLIWNFEYVCTVGYEHMRKEMEKVGCIAEPCVLHGLQTTIEDSRLEFTSVLFLCASKFDKPFNVLN